MLRSYLAEKCNICSDFAQNMAGREIVNQPFPPTVLLLLIVTSDASFEV